jgi:hypothetical protein
MDKILRSGKLLVVLTTVSNLAACVHISHPPYPDRWESPPSIAENVCTDLSGTFNASGEGPKGERPKLPDVFWGRTEFKQNGWPDSKFAAASHVTIEQTTETLIVSVWANTTMIARKELRKGEGNGYLCTTKGIAVKGEFPYVGGLAGYVGQTYTLFKVSDGGLIVKSEDTGGGLALLIPVYASESFWYRYPPYHIPAASPPASE